MKMVDRRAKVEGEPCFPDQPSPRKDLAAVKIFFRERGINAIYLFWKSQHGKIHHRKMVTALVAEYNLKVVKVSVHSGQSGEHDHAVHVVFSAPGLAEREISGWLPEGAEKWRAGLPKRSLRLLLR
jgi:hypothetical protein